MIVIFHIGQSGADNTTSDGVVDLNGNKVLKLVGDPNKRKFISQEISVSGKKGDIFTLYGWAKSTGIPNETTVTSTSIAARISVHIYKTDGTIQYENELINSGTDSWQFISRQISASADYNKIVIYIMFYKNANTIYYDNIKLFKEEFGESYQYDAKGNLISSQDLAKQNSTFQYSGNNELLKNINPKGGRFVYEYDYNRKGRLVNALDTKGTKYSFAYDTYGNTTAVKVEERDKIKKLEAEKTYYIKSTASDRYLDIKDGNTQDNGYAIQWFILQGNNQKFTFKKIDGEYYKIVPYHAQARALYYEKSDANYQIKQKTYQDNDLFKWKLIENENGTYSIENKSVPGYVVTLEENTAKVLLQKYEGKLNQCVELYGTDEGDVRSDIDALESNEVYYIRSKTTNLYLEHASDTDNASVTQSAFKEKNKNQLWRLTRDFNYTYRIVPLGSKDGKALSLSEDKNAQNQPIVIKKYTGAATQKWAIVKNENNTYSIRINAGGTTRYVKTLDNNKAAGTKIVVNTAGDQYYLEKANMLPTWEEGATYTLKVKISNLYVGVNGTNVEQQTQNNQDTQKWILHREAGGYYSFRLASDPTKTLDLAGGAIANRTNIQVKTANGNDSEKFEIVPQGNGTYMIKPKNGKGTTCVDIEGAKTTPGINISNYATNQSDAQSFYFTKVKSNNTNKYIQSKATYTTNGNYTTKVEDQLGNAINYTYNETKGTVSKTTDAKGTQINYTYDNLDRLTKVNTTQGTKTYQNEYTYENDKLKTILHNGFKYTFIYDNFGNQKQVNVGSQVLIANTYDTRNGNLNNSQYGNGQKISYTYDRFDRITKKTGTTGSYSYTYDGRGNLKIITDGVNGNTTTYTYDLANRVVKEENTNTYSAQYAYDKNNNVTKVTDKLGTDTKVTQYNYDLNNNINSIKLYNNALLVSNYDRLLRTTSKELKTENNKTYKTEYQYKDINSTRTTTQIKSMKNGADQALNYTYDKNGNIETISYGTELKHKYYYDTLNQLVREDDKDRNVTIVYTYDVGGNILNKKEYPYTEGENLPEAVKTTSYTYGNTNWKDQLTAYDGKAISYDAIGNPLTYNGNTYTWQNGRQLAGIANEGNSLVVTYKYNDSGIRTQKTVNGVTTTYYLSGSKVVYEKAGNNTIYYSYDEAGGLIGLRYNDTQYYYKKNLQGDIIGILDNNLEEVARYTYDSWGKILSITDKEGQAITDQNHIAHINPYRYRSYRYDSETDLYYLQSRYYNPEWGRFVNADGLVDDGTEFVGYNMFLYTGNNPINRIDSTGNSWLGDFLSSCKDGFTEYFKGRWNQITHPVETVKQHYSTADGWLSLSGIYNLAKSALAPHIQGANTAKALLTGDAKIIGRTAGEGWGQATETLAIMAIGYGTNKVLTSTNNRFPGYDAKKAPKGYEWRGSGNPGSTQGNWYNPMTKEWLHPDLRHPTPIGPHWDYGIKGNSQTFRIFPDGSMKPK